MASRSRQAVDILKLIPSGGPAVCNIAVTNVCNATCDFCNYAYDKGLVTDRKYIDYEKLCDALDILFRRGVRYLTFTGGETLLHPRIADMLRTAVEKGFRPSLVTNGWLLPQKLPQLQAAGLKTVFVSLDAPNAADHEKNRGLKDVCSRIREANRRMAEMGIECIASVTINKLIDDFAALPRFLRDLGFTSATFSYPKVDALGTSSLVFSETSSLIRFTPDELVAAYRSVDALKKDFTVLNPRESLADMQRHVRKEKERFGCLGGYKYFYMDYRFDMFRCDSWHEKMCSVWDFESTPFVRDGCTACMSDCYRDSSVLLALPVAIGDAIAETKKGRIGKAARALFAANTWRSIRALLEGSQLLARLGRTG